MAAVDKNVVEGIEDRGKRRVCLVIGGGEGESPRISEVIVFATTLKCDGDSVKRMCSVVGVPGSPLDGVVCLSVNILSIVVLILERSCVRIKCKYRYKYTV